jgi:hypothetical protein
MSSGKKVYNVQSSEVSGLIGRNKYCPREQAMLKFIKRMNYNNFKRLLRVINVREVYVIANELLSESGNIKDKFTEAICASNTDELQDKLKELYKEIENTNYYKTKKEYLQNEIKGRVYMTRGTKYEKKGIDQYQHKTKKKITNRNEEMIEKVVKRLPEYTIMLRSKIDGIDRANNCLIEHKNRVYELFDEIPVHEQVQLEIYMRVTGLSKCKLVQTHFNEVSEIDFVPTTQGWKEIKTKLIATMIEIHDLLGNEDKLKTFISKYRKYL